MIAADGTLQRRALRERIFANPEEKNWLNALLHPLIQQETQHQIQQATSLCTVGCAIAGRKLTV